MQSGTPHAPQLVVDIQFMAEDWNLVRGKAHKAPTARSSGPQHQSFHSANPLLRLHVTHRRQQSLCLPKRPGELWERALELAESCFSSGWKLAPTSFLEHQGMINPGMGKLICIFKNPLGFLSIFFFIPQNICMQHLRLQSRSDGYIAFACYFSKAQVT